MKWSRFVSRQRSSGLRVSNLRRQMSPPLSGQSPLGREGPPSTATKTLAAFHSSDCCLGHPKVKLFASERSPNVSHQLLSHSLPESLRDISAI
jgi:hypothetical protein